MGWAIASACSSKGCQRATPSKYLQVLVSSTNKEGITQIENFMKYVEQRISDLFKVVNYANIKNVQIRYFNSSGKMSELYKGDDLTEDKYENILSKLKN